MIQILHTNPGDPDFHSFENLPVILYSTDSRVFNRNKYISLEFWDEGFLLMKGNVAVGRASLYYNPGLHYKGKKTYSIGNYEMIDNKDDAEVFIQYIVEIVKKKGGEFVIGPMCGSTWENYRFALDWDLPPVVTEHYHFLYYNQHFLQMGFMAVAEYFSAKDTEMKYDAPGVLSLHKKFSAMGVKIRELDKSDLHQELISIFNFNQLAFAQNFLYTPISLSSFLLKNETIIKSIDPRYFLIAEDEAGNVLGYFFCVANHLPDVKKSLVIKTIARHADEKWKGLGHVIGNEIYRRAAEDGFKSIIHAYMHAHGSSTKISHNFSGKVFRNYRLYGRSI